MANENISEGTRELVDLSAEALGSLGVHLAQIGTIMCKAQLPPNKGDKGAARKLQEKLEKYKAYSEEVTRRRRDIEVKMKEDFERLTAWRAECGTEGADLIQEIEALYHKVRSQEKTIKEEAEKLAAEKEETRRLSEFGLLKDRKWAALAEAYARTVETKKEEGFQRGGISSWLQCSFDEIRFKWKAAEEKEKLRIQHHQKMRKARAQSRLDVIGREKMKRLLQACVLAMQEETVERRNDKYLRELRTKNEEESMVLNAQLAQALGDEEKAKALIEEQMRRINEARDAQKEEERLKKIAQKEARDARIDADNMREEARIATEAKEAAEAKAAQATADMEAAQADAKEARHQADIAERARLKAQADQRQAEDQVKKKQKKIQGLQRMLAELGAESDSDAPPDERAPAFFVNEDGTKVPRPRTRKERMGMAYREAESSRFELRIGMAAMIDSDGFKNARIDNLRTTLGDSLRQVQEVRWANKVLIEENAEGVSRVQRAEALAQQAKARAQWLEEKVSGKMGHTLQDADATWTTASEQSRPSTSASHFGTGGTFRASLTSAEDLTSAPLRGPPFAPLAPSTAGLTSASPTRPHFYPADGEGRSPRFLLKTASTPMIMPSLYGMSGSPVGSPDNKATSLAPLRKVVRKPQPDWRMGWH